MYCQETNGGDSVSKKKHIWVSLVFLLATTLVVATLPEAFGAQPLPSPWPPEEEWHPLSPEEARPEIGIMIVIYGGEFYLEAGQPFYLWYRWGLIPTNRAYNLSNMAPVTPI